jgi:hypothetical protein
VLKINIADLVLCLSRTSVRQPARINGIFFSNSSLDLGVIAASASRIFSRLVSVIV